jgi:hypothetical protein
MAAAALDDGAAAAPPLHRLAAAAALAVLLAAPLAPLAPPPAAFAATTTTTTATESSLLQLEPGLLPDDDNSNGDNAPGPATVPRGYHNTVTGLVASVRDALDADAEGEAERKVRRRADPARERVREFVGKWRDAPPLVGQVYHEEVKAAISELGAFYARAGPRAAVTRDVRDSVLRHLARAERTLPPAEKGLLGF